MSLFNALFLGILQGLTEFLPVSSSGHLVLAEHFLGLTIDPQDLQSFDIVLHAGTGFAILICYAEIWRGIVGSIFTGNKKYRTLLLQLIVATIPAALVGVLFDDFIASAFRSIPAVAFALCITGVILFFAEKITPAKDDSVSWRHAIAMGIIQSFALIPGISRSGLTISAGQINGLKRKEALDFSFQMALPIIAGATVLTLLDVAKGEVVLPSFTVSVLGFTASFIVSMFAVISLRKLVAKYSLSIFAYYLVPMGLLILALNV